MTQFLSAYCTKKMAADIIRSVNYLYFKSTKILSDMPLSKNTSCHKWQKWQKYTNDRLGP